jgi:hypothetical protein
MINGKAELMLSKEFGNYKPNLILSKTIYYDGGDLVLVNNYHLKNHVLTASAAYNTTGILQIGGQYMIKTPNVEFYIGSDQLIKSYEMLRNYVKQCFTLHQRIYRCFILYGVWFKIRECFRASGIMQLKFQDSGKILSGIS